jgi:hypothetical protein
MFHQFLNSLCGDYALQRHKLSHQGFGRIIRRVMKQPVAQPQPRCCKHFQRPAGLQIYERVDMLKWLHPTFPLFRLNTTF